MLKINRILDQKSIENERKINRKCVVWSMFSYDYRALPFHAGSRAIQPKHRCKWMKGLSSPNKGVEARMKGLSSSNKGAKTRIEGAIQPNAMMWKGYPAPCMCESWTSLQHRKPNGICKKPSKHTTFLGWKLNLPHRDPKSHPAACGS